MFLLFGCSQLHALTRGAPHARKKDVRRPRRRWRTHAARAQGRLREGRQGKAETHKRYKDMRACIHTISYYTFEYIYIYMFIFMRLQ